MFFWTLSLIGSWLLDLLAIVRLTDSEKDLELLLLRRQINILERTTGNPLRLSRLEKLSLAVLANKLKERSGLSRRQLDQFIFIFTPTFNLFSIQQFQFDILAATTPHNLLA